ncbi:MAG: lipid A deacylase LpxR family protein [Bacteroidales bacterium]|nr:lipid A deacylase LpxR family protein [Bacteroidales bacterium]
MKISRFIILILILQISNNVAGQLVYQPHTFRIYLDNDFLNFRGSGTDRYFTNGLRMDFYYTKKQKVKFPSSLLLKISDDNNVFGWGIAQFMFTPKHIDVKEIQYGDRPYAGALYMIHSLQSINNIQNIKITTEMFFGVIGQLSLAKESQTWIHEMINYTKPEGWGNQISNDLILNYNINIEKQLLYPSKSVLLVGFVETFSGTLYNAAGAGFMLRIGKFDNYLDGVSFSPGSSKNKFQLFVFMRPTARIVLSNALLQGGLIHQMSSHEDTYALDKDQLERLNVLYQVGLNFEMSKFSISISQKLQTSEFKGQYVQEVGNITTVIKL